MCLWSPAVRVAANGKLDEVLANMERAARSIKTIEADMRQEIRDGQIGGLPERYSGRIYFEHRAKNSDRVRINYSQPPGQVGAVDGDRITFYQPKINQVTITSRRAQAAKNQEFSFIATPYKSIPELKSQYNIVYAGDEKVDSASTAKLEMTPKGESSVEKLTLWVDGNSWLPIKYQVVEYKIVKNKKVTTFVTTFTLTDLKLNKGLPGNIFKVDVAPGTKVVRQ